MSVRQRTSALFGGALVALVLLLAGAASANPFGWVFSDHDPRVVNAPEPTPVALPTETASPENVGDPGPAHDPLVLPAWVQDLMTFVALALLLVIVGLLIWFAVKHWPKRRRTRERAVAEGPTEDFDDTGLTEELRRSARGTLAALDADELDAEDAVIRCWQDFAAAAAAHGVGRQATDTSTEFTARVLGRGGVTPEAAQELAELYRLAMFGGWTPAQADATRAADCLRRIVDDLEAAEPAVPRA